MFLVSFIITIPRVGNLVIRTFSEWTTKVDVSIPGAS